jgi:hypothetical protein
VGDPDTATLAYWNEHRQQLRQSESQRATLTNYVLVITAALTGLVAQYEFGPRALPLAILIIVVGGYGAVASAKYHERANYHLHQARALTKALSDAGALLDNAAVLEQARADHNERFPLLYRIRLHTLWTTLNAAIALFGTALAAVVLWGP